MQTRFIIRTILAILLGITVSPCTSFAQYKIQGKVFDRSGIPIEYVEILLLRRDSVVIKSELSNNAGYFLLKADTGMYIVQCKYFGQFCFTKNLIVREDVDMGNVQLDASKNLRAIQITSSKKLIERKVDRVVFNLENSVSASGGDAIEALKVTPGLRVQNDAVQMIGKSGMAIMIDDRLIQLTGEDLFSFLRTIRSEDIKSIEVINNPPAKYEADGNSGIVNIRLRKAKKNSLTGSQRISATQATHLLSTFGNAMGYQRNKITITTNLNYTNGSNAPYQEYRILFPGSSWFETNSARSFQNNFNGRATIDYKLSEKTSVGLQYSGIYSNPIRRGLNASSITNKTTALLDSTLLTPSYTRHRRNSQAINLHLQTNLDSSGRKITFDADYLQYNVNISNTFSTNTFLAGVTVLPDRFLSAKNSSDQAINVYSSRIDIETPFLNTMLNFGGKISFIRNFNTVDFFKLNSGSPVFDPSNSNVFEYFENTQALYLSSNISLSKKWQLQAGLRLESTQAKGVSRTLDQVNRNNYTRLFPTFYILYKADEEKSFALNYNRRIDRPAYGNLNPFRFFSTAYNYSEGNPFLQPFFTHNIDLSYTKNNFFGSVFLRVLTEGIDQVTFISADNTTQIVRPFNFYTSKTIGLMGSYVFNRLKWWESTNQCTIFYTQTNTKNLNVQSGINNSTYSISSNNSFVIQPKSSTRAELNISYQSASVSGSYKLSRFYQVDVGIRRQFFTKKIQLALNAFDVLRTNAYLFTQLVNNIQQQNYDYADLQRIRLSVTYNFGKSFKTERRNLSNEDERSRIN